MSKLIDIDTNVWLDYFLHRDKGMLSPADISLAILKRSISCEFRIVISDILLIELESYVDQKNLREVLGWLSPKLFVVDYSKEDLRLARKIPVHYPDCIHVYLAQKYEAKLISNDYELLSFGAILARTL
jgi:predicted nucleic acid-binding protein